MRAALLVGVNTHQGPNPLIGCVNDVKDMAAYLVGIGVDRLVALCDADATKDAVIDALREGIASLRSGDELIVHFSGHGALLPGDNAVHAVLCPCDFDQDRGVAIYDAEVGELLKGLNDGARFTAVIDACYAGGLQPDFALLNGVASGPPHRIRSFPPGDAVAAKLGRLVPTPVKLRTALDRTFSEVAKGRRVVLMAACSIHVTAAETRFSRHTNGAFTHYLLSTLDQPKPPATAQLLLDDVVAALHEYPQAPELHGNPQLFGDPFLLRPPRRSPSPPSTPPSPIPTGVP